MSKRRLSDQQRLRIAENQQNELSGADSNPSVIESSCNGRIISHYGQQLDVEILGGENAGDNIRCHQRANLPPLVTGDLVLWEQDSDEAGIIVATAKRRNVFGRPDAQAKFKAIAANLDFVLVVFAVVPEPFLNFIDRYLVAISNLGLEPLLVLNKVDLLGSNPSEEIDKMLSIYRGLDYAVLEVSATQGTGIEALQAKLKDKTTVLVGQSGVGKSSLVNRLGFDQLADVGDLSQSKYKGTHTTTTSRLFHLGNFDLIDSPGIREFSLGHISADDVLDGFQELKNYATECKFRDCRHDREPGCAIQEAIENGSITAERFESFQRILVSME
jgi:ribosome biogenesis GTPase / thiamine phosphate phosphatase